MDMIFRSIKTYGMYATNAEFHQNSSSGGVFSLLAEAVLTRGGVVFGAAFCNDFKSVKHIGITRMDDLPKLQGSKYIRSSISEAVMQAKDLLADGVEVLFSGTPCQISALKHSIKEDYSNLYTVAVICHGTPKASVWHDYATELEQKYNSTITAVNFRDKSESYKKYSICIQFANGKQYRNTKDQDIYMCGFLQNITLEKSCFQCQFKGNNIESDIILGDFWGVENVASTLQNNCGTSLVIVRSEKGMEMIQPLLCHTKHQETDVNSAVNGNSSLLCSAKKPDSYDVFWQSYDPNCCSKSIQKYMKHQNYFILLAKKIVRTIIGRKK